MNIDEQYKQYVTEYIPKIFGIDSIDDYYIEEPSTEPSEDIYIEYPSCLPSYISSDKYISRDNSDNNEDTNTQTYIIIGISVWLFLLTVMYVYKKYWTRLTMQKLRKNSFTDIENNYNREEVYAEYNEPF